MMPPKTNNFLETEFKDMGYCNVTDKEFKVAIMKKFSNL